VQLGHDLAQEICIAGFDAVRDFIGEFAADFASFRAHAKAVEHGANFGCGKVHIFGHGRPSPFDRMLQVCLS